MSELKSELLKIPYFWLKKWKVVDDFYFEIQWPPLELLLPNLPRKAELAWPVSMYLWKEIWKKEINGTTFHNSFYLRYDNFKSLDFSPLTKRVLAGVIMDII